MEGPRPSSSRSTGGTSPAATCLPPPIARRARRVAGAGRVDVGSADGPSVGWLRGTRLHLTARHRPARPERRRGLRLGAGAARSPTAASTWSRRSTCSSTASPEDARSASSPGSSPRWPAADVGAGLHVGLDALRRRQRAPSPLHPSRRAVARGRGARAGGRAVDVRLRLGLPVFAAERLARRAKAGVAARPRLRPRTSSTLPQVPRWMSRCPDPCAGSTGACSRRRDLPFGSSVLVAAKKAEAARLHSTAWARGHGRGTGCRTWISIVVPVYRGAADPPRAGARRSSRLTEPFITAEGHRLPRRRGDPGPRQRPRRLRPR